MRHAMRADEMRLVLMYAFDAVSVQMKLNDDGRVFARVVSKPNIMPKAMVFTASEVENRDLFFKAVRQLVEQ